MSRFATAVAIAFATAQAARIKKKVLAESGSTSSSLLRPVSVLPPDETLHPSRGPSFTRPSFNEVDGPLHTNKFWGSWLIAEAGGPGFSIFPGPWQLRWGQAAGSPAGKLMISHRVRDIQGADLIIAHFNEMLSLSVVEDLDGHHAMVKEDHFGVHMQVRGNGRSVTYPIYAGMAYVTAEYSGKCTPSLMGGGGLRSVTRVSNGIFAVVTNQGETFRVYALTKDGRFTDGSYSFDSNGIMNKQLEGWVRVAHVTNDEDTSGYDEHAGSILTGWGFEVEKGSVRYNFETVDAKSVGLLHYGYSNHLKLLENAAPHKSMKKMHGVVKGDMTPIVGDTWVMRIDTGRALKLDLLPDNTPASKYNQTLTEELNWYLNEFTTSNYYLRVNLFKKDHYFSAKGFQKLGYVCLMAARHFGKGDARTQACASALVTAFECMYKRDGNSGDYWRYEYPDAAADWEQEGCAWAPPGTFYDTAWKGLPSRWSDGGICGVDFGNACYNDHHYHYGYFVVAGAILLELKPEYAKDTAFVDFINMFIRDTANPSKDDTFFPQFRAFDWFDMHSWSRGIYPNPNGKDQESTSEEVNLHFGILQWGRRLGNEAMMNLGATMLAFASVSLQDHFLMMRDNENYPLFFNENHVTGIFFQGKVHITTWFGGKREYIQGIQMLPLTPAVPLSRTQEFTMEEYDDQVSWILPTLVHDPNAWDPYGGIKWKTLLMTGNVAFHQPKETYDVLNAIPRSQYDDGLTKIWALYWTTTVCTSNCDVYREPTTKEPPAPPPSAGGPGGPGGDIYCNPDLGQMCPGGIPCPSSGKCPKDGEAAPAPPSSGGGSGGGSGITCRAEYGQLCPGGIPCPDSGVCPEEGESPPSSGGGGSGIFCNPALGQLCPGGIACPECGSGACECP